MRSEEWGVGSGKDFICQATVVESSTESIDL